MRKYTTFGSNDKQAWTELGVVEADNPGQARKQARDDAPDWTHYAATTTRGWSPGTPTDKVVTTWEEINPDQLTVDDELTEEEEDEEQARIEEMLARGKDALHGAEEEE